MARTTPPERAILAKRPEAGAGEVRGHVADHQRVAQVRLVRAVVQHRLRIGDARPGPGIHGAPSAKRSKVPRITGSMVAKDVLLRDEAHLDVELVEHQRAVGAAGLVAEAGGDLEVAVEARDHRQLLELLRRLRQRVELAGMQAAGTRKSRAPSGLLAVRIGVWNSVETLVDHAAADGGDDRAAQHQVAVLAFAAQGR
jgi:hypothetical protein